MDDKTVGIALGGGGVRGLAHIPILMALDELGIKPSVVMGTSMGAIVGALYASGMSGKAIDAHVRQHLWLKDDDLEALYKKRKQLVKWVRAITPEWGGAGFIKADGVFSHLFDQLQSLHFDQLPITFGCFACDYWTGDEVMLNQGLLLPAVQASMAVPGVFTPVTHGQQLLVDGGLANNLPYEAVAARADICIAIDVTNPPPAVTSQPSVFDIATDAIDIMQLANLNHRFKHQQPDVFIRPKLAGIDVFDFHRIEDVLAAGEVAAEALKKQVLALQ